MAVVPWQCMSDPGEMPRTKRPTRSWRRAIHGLPWVGALAAAVGVFSIAALAAVGGEPRVLGRAAGSDFRDMHLAAGAVIDARAATFFAGPTNRYPIALGGGAGICFAGGTVIGRYDRAAGWTAMHDLNNAALAFENVGATIDGLRADNVTDGIRPRPGGRFSIANVWLSYVRDDCIENDHLEGGTVRDAFLDGCYVAFSARPSPSKVRRGLDGSGNTWIIRDSLVRLAAMPGPRKGAAGDRGHGGFFKWHKWDHPRESRSPGLALHGNVFLAETRPSERADRLGIPPGRLVGCADNVIVWLGAGEFPGRLPSDCFRVTTDRRVWDDAVAAWRRRHGAEQADGLAAPLVGRPACGLAPR
jgi:hypothetical protein